MGEVRLHHVFNYTDVDRAFWAEHLEDWVPQRLVDAHMHVNDPSFQIETVTEEMRKSFWVCEVNDPCDAETADHCLRTTFPGREVSCVAFGHPSFGVEIEGSNEWLRVEGLKRNWHMLVVVRPTWVAEQVDWWLSKPGIIGVKPYYSLIGYSRTSHDTYIESSIFSYLPHHQFEVLNEREAWVTLHVPHAERLGHPDNQREIREIRARYPRVKLVIAHLGRSYTEPHAREGLLPLADDPGVYFDCSAVLNPDVLYLALKHIGPSRILYGTDNPVFYMRGRRQWNGRTYINRTSYPFYFNKEREAPEIEARYTLYMYEALRALRNTCERLGYGREEVEALFEGNARRLIAGVLEAKARKTPV